MPMTEANKEVVRRYVAAFNAGDWDVLRSLFTADAQIQGVLAFGGIDLAVGVWKELHAAFGVKLAIEVLVAEGDIVAARFTESGTFVAPFRGLPSTGKTYSINAMEFFHIVGGRISRRWGARDSATLFRQLGSPMPAPPASSPAT